MAETVAIINPDENALKNIGCVDVKVSNTVTSLEQKKQEQKELSDDSDDETEGADEVSEESISETCQNKAEGSDQKDNAGQNHPEEDEEDTESLDPRIQASILRIERLLLILYSFLKILHSSNIKLLKPRAYKH